jgi:hypothetical protein
MDFLIALALGFISGAIVAWIFLPEPAFIRRFFIKIGWAKPAA